MFIREDLISAQFKLKEEITSLHSQIASARPSENIQEIRLKILSLEEKLKQVRNISGY